MAPAKTRRPHAATRYLDTAVGALSYRQLAPLLAERVAVAELEIFERRFAALQAYDQNNPRPLMDIWRQRLSEGEPS